jgi:hypothetical protein
MAWSSPSLDIFRPGYNPAGKDWTLEPHTVPIIRALEGATVRIRLANIESKTPYVNFDCYHSCRSNADGAGVQRGVANKDKDNSALFTLTNSGSGYFLRSVATGRNVLRARSNEEFRFANDANGSGTGYDMLFWPTVLNPEDALKTDGNYTVRTTLVMTQPNEGAMRQNEVVPQAYPIFAAAEDDNVNGWRYYRNELLVGSRRPVAQALGERNAERIYIIETVFPPDIDRWLANDDNKISCCRGTAGAREATSCVGSTGINWVSSRANCDLFVRQWSLTHLTHPLAQCFKLEQDIENDPDLRDLSPLPPVSRLLRSKGLTRALTVVRRYSVRASAARPRRMPRPI